MANRIKIEHARIGFRNFSGAEAKYNPPGRRNFCVFLDSDFAEELTEEGWNIKWLKPKNDNDEPQAYMQVSVSFAKFPPNIFLVTRKQKTRLDESMLNMLDWAELENVDLMINPRPWDDGGTTRIKAYLRTMYATIVEDEFAEKYDDIPDSALSSMME